MDRAIFEAAELLAEWLEALGRETEANLREIADELCWKRGPQPDAQVRRMVVADCVREIGEWIEDLLMDYDRLCRAAGVPPRFDVALDVLDAPRPVQLAVGLFLADRRWRRDPEPPRPEANGRS